MRAGGTGVAPPSSLSVCDQMTIPPQSPSIDRSETPDMEALAVRRNPALLKLDLYCRGMRMDDSCFIEEDGGRKIMRTRAGLGSGLEAILPGGLWTNVPVVEEFAKVSPYSIHHRDGGFWIDRDDLRPVASIRLSPQPDWYGRTT